MSEFDENKRNRESARGHTMWQPPRRPPMAPQVAPPGPPSLLPSADSSAQGRTSESDAHAAALMAHMADASPEHQGSVSQSDAHAHPGWGLGKAWRSLTHIAARGYDAVSGATGAAGERIHRAEQGLDHGVDWAESQLQRPSRWIADQAQGVPGIGTLAQGYASVSKHATHFLGGLAKGAGSMVFGLGNMAVHPIDTLRGLATMGSHLPGTPFWLARQGYQGAKGIYDEALHGAKPGHAGNGLNPLTAIREDGDYWKGVGTRVIEPYRAAVREDKPMEAVGRGAFDIGSLLLGTGEAKAAAEAGDLARAAEVSKAGEVSKLGEASDLARIGEGTEAAKTTKLAPTETASPKYHSIYEDGNRVPANGEPARLPEGPDPRAEGPHTRLRWDEQSPARSGQGAGRVYQGREFDSHGNPMRDIDFTSPTYPSGRPRPDHLPPPHEHRWFLNDPKNPKSNYKRSKNPTPFEP